jgi:integrase/recombinase XerD
MSKQAKTLTAQELRSALDYVATRRHAARNKALLLSMYLAGLCVGEAAALRYEDVLDAEGKVRSEISLDAEQTKGRYGRVVFVSEKLRKELQGYVRSVPYKAVTDKLFYSQKKEGEGFTANTLCQFFHHLFKACGIEGARVRCSCLKVRHHRPISSNQRMPARTSLTARPTNFFACAWLMS